MPNRQAPLDRVFQALGDPARLGMLERLRSGPASISDLAEPLAMSLPAVLQHVQVLEASGLIRTEKTGRVRICRLERAGVQQVEAWVARQRAALEAKLDRLGEYLAAQDKEGEPK